MGKFNRLLAVQLAHPHLVGWLPAAFTLGCCVSSLFRIQFSTLRLKRDCSQIYRFSCDSFGAVVCRARDVRFFTREWVRVRRRQHSFPHTLSREFGALGNGKMVFQLFLSTMKYFMKYLGCQWIYGATFSLFFLRCCYARVSMLS